MTRISLSDGSGRWFDADKAICHEEDTYWNGHNFISAVTNSQFHHEAIYITASMIFIKCSYSDYASTQPVYEIISKASAAVWFAKQSFSDKEIPEIFTKEVYEMEIN